MRRTHAMVVAAIAGGVVALGVLIISLRHRLPSAVADRTLTLYCATDREIAQDLIDQFQRQTGIRVQTKFDTESAKSVGLVQAIRQEKANPQCDVLWGGGAYFATMLANDGCLRPAPADVITAHGAAPRDPQGRWLGFAGVYRILIVNTDVLTDPAQRPTSIFDLTDPKYKGHVGIANPLFGGMAAHVAAISAALGEPAMRQWLQGLKANDVALCAGMADVKNRVASGELWFGITSTIDAHVAVVGGKPVTIIYPDQRPDQIGCMNGFNSVALVAGGPHPNEAEAFLRFLMTEQTEQLLSQGPGQNIGMLPQSVAADVRPAWIPKDVHTMPVDWSAATADAPAMTKAVHEILLGR